MSADNGVYILKTGNQYRVKHLQAIDNLYWTGSFTSNQIQPLMVQNMFGDCKYTYNLETALKIATNIRKHLMVCEYGVQIIDAGMDWNYILNSCKEKGRNIKQ